VKLIIHLQLVPRGNFTFFLTLLWVLENSAEGHICTKATDINRMMENTGTKYYLGNQIVRTKGKRRMHIIFLEEKLKGRNHLEDFGEEGRT
jgi:hypothetical protein